MRRSAAEIDRAILDVAAGMFATHGYAHTSVQQVADAVGYSKPGLLHRFGSKEALHRAVLAEVGGTVREVLARAREHEGRADRVTTLLELLVRNALDRPGMAQMTLRAARHSGEPGLANLDAGRLLDVLGHRDGDPGDPGRPADRLRALLALELVVGAAGAQHSGLPELHVDRATLVPLVVTLASQVVGAEPG